MFELKPYHSPDFNTAFFNDAPDACYQPAERDGIVPEGYHALSIYPEYFKINGQWLLAAESRMDCVAVYEDSRILVKEARRVRKGEKVIIGRSEDGSQGIYMHTDGFREEEKRQENFRFRQSHSRETSFSRAYDEIYELLEHERDHGYIVWVMGPALSFDADAKKAFQKLVENGYVDALMAGNALATHDLEGSYLNTALGQNIYTREHGVNGHYNHLDVLNEVRTAGSIKQFIKNKNITNGIMYALETNDIPYVLAGSIRDDGPLPEVIGNVYEAQNKMREHVSKATTIISMATTLHAIAIGNMAPSFRVLEDGTIRQVYFYTVDISEFAVNKLGDRGSLSSRGIITNVQDFVVNVAKGLKVY